MKSERLSIPNTIYLLLVIMCAFALATLISIYFDQVLNFFVIKVGLGWVFSTILNRLLVMLFFILGLTALLKLIRNGKRTKRWIPILSGMVLGFLLSFSFAQIYNVDYFMLDDGLEFTDLKKLEIASDSTYIRQENKYELIAFLDVGCDHCQLVCKKLGLNKAAGQKIQTQVFFTDELEYVDHFLETYGGTELNHYFIPNTSSFLEFANYEFPSVYLIDPQGKTEHHWLGERLNYTALDYLLSLEQ